MKTNSSLLLIDPEILQHYLKIREGINRNADRISHVSRIIGLVQYCDDDTVPISTRALAFFSDMINSDACRILEYLDEFLHVLDEKSALNE